MKSEPVHTSEELDDAEATAFAAGKVAGIAEERGRIIAASFKVADKERSKHDVGTPEWFAADNICHLIHALRDK